MNRHMDKVEGVCDHNLTPKFNEFSSDDLGGWTDDIEFQPKKISHLRL